MGNHIKPEGWHNWNKPDAEKNTFYAEYKNNGEGSKTNNRVKWSHQLNDNEIQNYTVANILGDWILQYINN